LLDFQKLPPNIEAKAVFCNNQMSLAEVDVYGFDFYYTLGKAQSQCCQVAEITAKNLRGQKKCPPQLIIVMIHILYLVSLQYISKSLDLHVIISANGVIKKMLQI